jgi:hypothetical protein
MPSLPLASLRPLGRIEPALVRGTWLTIDRIELARVPADLLEASAHRIDRSTLRNLGCAARVRLVWLVVVHWPGT